MDAPVLSPEHARELEQLRRRAYGPDGDIAGDPAALARLSELEATLRAADDPERPTASSPVPEPTRDGEREPVSELARAEGDRDAPPAASAPVRPAWVRRVPATSWFLAALALLVVATIVWGVGRITEPWSDASLAPTEAPADLPEPLLQQGFTGYYEIEPGSFRSYESFRTLSVWSATTTGGARCLMVVTEQFRFNSQVSCTPSGLDPTVDYTVWPGLPPEIAQDLPQGSVFRFVLQDGLVQVWVRAAEEIVPS